MSDIRIYEAMAKCALSETEREWASALLETFTGSFRELAALDTAEEEPLITVLDIRNVLREDRVEKTIAREELLVNAPARYDGYFQVPKTLE